MKVFSFGQILSIYTGRLMCPIDKVYEILDFLHNTNLFTHQLPRASDDAKPWLLESLPWLDGITCDEITPDNVLNRLEYYESKYGTLHPLEAIPHNKELKRHPVTELVDILGNLEAE